jgi:hypothetical protein
LKNNSSLTKQTYFVKPMKDCPASVARKIQRSTRKIYSTQSQSSKVSNYRSYKTSATGKFHCSHCKRAWESFKVSIVLRFSPDKSHFTIVVMGQQCLRCEREFCSPIISKSEWERVCGKFKSVLLTTPEPNGAVQERSQTDTTKEHNSKLCEACKLNMCDQSSLNEIKRRVNY